MKSSVKSCIKSPAKRAQGPYLKKDESVGRGAAHGTCLKKDESVASSAAVVLDIVAFSAAVVWNVLNEVVSDIFCPVASEVSFEVTRSSHPTDREDPAPAPTAAARGGRLQPHCHRFLRSTRRVVFAPAPTSASPGSLLWLHFYRSRGSNGNRTPAPTAASQGVLLWRRQRRPYRPTDKEGVAPAPI